MHRDLLKSMTLSLFSVCKLSGKPLERKKSVGDRPRRQTVLMVFPSLAMFGSGVWWVFAKVLQNLGLNLSFPFYSYYSPKRAKSPLPDVIMGLTWGSTRAEGLGLRG